MGMVYLGDEIFYNKEHQLYIRKSMIEDYYFCPYKFYKSWIDKDVKVRSNYQSILDMGTRFHEFAYTFFDYMDAERFDRWNELIPYDHFNSQEIDRCEWFIEQEQLRFIEMPEELYRPVAREIRLIDEELLLTSVCDRIDWVTDKTTQIVEYKTSKKFDDKSLVRQMSFYAYIWNKGYGYPVVSLKVINPRLKEIRIYEYEEDYTFNTLEDIYEIRTAMGYDDYPRKCNPIKHIICGVCNPYECGCYDSENVGFLEHRESE